MIFRANYCQKCGKRIPRRVPHIYGGTYRPVVCSECAGTAKLANWLLQPPAGAPYYQGDPEVSPSS